MAVSPARTIGLIPPGKRRSGLRELALREQLPREPLDFPTIHIAPKRDLFALEV
jgi:hypothetical protein